jgi:hypothetical protein
MTEPYIEPPGEEGNDQDASTGVEVPVLTDDDLEDAPEVSPEDEDVPDPLEPDGPHTPAPPEAPPEEDGS